MASKEQRKSLRHKSNLGGQISTGDRNRRVACRILDLSAGGARLRIEEEFDGGRNQLPDRLGLIFNIDRVNVECVTAWRVDNELGVKFCSPFERF